MSDQSKQNRRCQLVRELISGLLLHERELGQEGYELLQLLRAAGYHDCADLYQRNLIQGLQDKADVPQHH